MTFDDIILDPKLHASVNYAKARIAIDALSKNRKERRTAKQIIIDHLKGSIEVVEVRGKLIHKVVRFNDGSTAKY